MGGALHVVSTNDEDQFISRSQSCRGMQVVSDELAATFS